MSKSEVQDRLEQGEDTQKGKYLTFTMEKETYGIEIRFVTEIIGIQPITAVPELPEYIRGIINLRGKIIPVMDVGLRFKKPFRLYNDRTCIIVIDINEISIGLIVDSVSEVLVIRDEDIVEPPDISNGGHKYIKGIGKVGSDIKLLLDCEKMLNDNDIEYISNVG
jgi:purine-binding chemotaxis protein CheW